MRDTLEKLVVDHSLLVVTKGDITDQMAKVDASGLADLFWQVEVVGEKDEVTYRAVLARYGIDPATFTMVGNSVVSDVLPVLALGGRVHPRPPPHHLGAGGGRPEGHRRNRVPRPGHHHRRARPAGRLGLS